MGEPARDRLPIERRILDSFRGRVPSRGLPWWYQLSVAISAAVVLLLPVVYFALMAAVAFATVWHAGHNASWMARPPGGGLHVMAAVFLAYVTPLLTGILVFLTMAGPLFSWTRRADRDPGLDAGREPFLYAFVDRLCRELGAPSPDRIEIDTKPNAAAGSYSGLAGLFRNRHLLILGLPLIRCLTVRQLTGIVAHEVGHLAQRGARRLELVIDLVLRWFSRAVYERNAWDEALESFSSDTHWTVMLFALTARGTLWLVRKILFGLMLAGHFVCRHMVRQREFEADRCEALVAGSACFEETTRRVLEICLACEIGERSLEQAWRDRRLPDDLGALAAKNMDALPEPVRKALVQNQLERKARWWEDHPSHEGRIAAARALDAPGILACDLPASELFRDFVRVSREATLRHYREVLGDAVLPEHVVAFETWVGGRKAENDSQDAMRRWFAGCVSSLRPLPVRHESPRAPVGRAAAIEELKAARMRLGEAAPAWRRAGKRIDDLDEEILAGAGATTLLGLSLPRGHEKIEELRAEWKSARERGRLAAIEVSSTGVAMEAGEAAAEARLFLALSLLEDSTVASRVADAPGLRERAAPLLRLARLFPELHKARMELRMLDAGVSALIRIVRSMQGDNAIYASLGVEIGKLRASALLFLQAVGPAPYPFASGATSGLLREHLMPLFPDTSADVAGAVAEMLERYRILYYRTYAALAGIGAAVESALGLQPLAETRTPPVVKALDRLGFFGQAEETPPGAERKSGS